MSRHKLFAQGLKSSNILNMMLGYARHIEPHTGSKDTLAFHITSAKGMPEIEISSEAVQGLRDVTIENEPLGKYKWIVAGEGLALKVNYAWCKLPKQQSM